MHLNHDESSEDYRKICARRDFMSAATRLAMIGAFLNLVSGESFGADENQVREFMTRAINAGDMGAALERYGDDLELTPRQVRVLSQIDRRESRVLKSLSRQADQLRLTKTQRVRLAAATLDSPEPKRLLERAEDMGLSREQLAGLEDLSFNQLETFRKLAGKLEGSGTLSDFVISCW